MQDDNAILGRFQSKYREVGDCLIWTAGTMKRGGYGVFTMRLPGKARPEPIPAHRVAWWLRYGKWPDSNTVLAHTCGNHACVRVEHLRLKPVGRTLSDRFWLKVEKSETCWTWTGSKTEFGYGHMQTTPKKYEASHRISWRLHRGDIPTGMVVMHECDNPACVRPDHLRLGSLRDNSEDMTRKDRAGAAKLTTKDVGEIREALARGDKVSVLARAYGVTHGAIYHIRQGRTWSCA